MTTFPDRRYFGRVAEESGFRAGPLETVFRLAQLLGQIDERLGDELLLRGGTALNLFHLDLPRLSVDIDLDFVGAADAEQAQARRLELLTELEALAQSVGYQVAQERASYAMATCASITSAPTAFPHSSSWTSTSSTACPFSPRLALRCGTHLEMTSQLLKCRPSPCPSSPRPRQSR
jgi:hypothetical protein